MFHFLKLEQMSLWLNARQVGKSERTERWTNMGFSDNKKNVQ